MTLLANWARARAPDVGMPTPSRRIGAKATRRDRTGPPRGEGRSSCFGGLATDLGEVRANRSGPSLTFRAGSPASRPDEMEPGSLSDDRREAHGAGRSRGGRMTFARPAPRLQQSDGRRTIRFVGNRHNSPAYGQLEHRLFGEEPGSGPPDLGARSPGPCAQIDVSPRNDPHARRRTGDRGPEPCVDRRTDRHQPVLLPGQDVPELGLPEARQEALRRIDRRDEARREADRPDPVPGGRPRHRAI